MPVPPLGILEQHLIDSQATEKVSIDYEGGQEVVKGIYLDQVEDVDQADQGQQGDQPADEEIVDQDEQLQHLALTFSMDTDGSSVSWESQTQSHSERSPHGAMIGDVLLKAEEGGADEKAKEQGRVEGFLGRLARYFGVHPAISLSPLSTVRMSHRLLLIL